MSEPEGEKLQVYLRLTGERMERFLRIKESMGLKNDTEVLRSLITWYWKTHSAELAPTLALINANKKGIQIFDRTILRIVPMLFSRNSLKCTHCKTDDCKHITFAMEHPEVNKLLQKRKEKPAP